MLIVLIGMELFARFYLGLGSPPLYIEDKNYEYIYAPNQHLKRFGNRISTNEFSMRSKPLSKKDKIRILKIGDSIINGGAQTDQDSLASSILEAQLSTFFHNSIRVLNVGANSWGPDNAFEYVKKNGNFNASKIILVFSSHDLHDLMHHQKVVGKYTAWPDKKPFCALSDGFFKYFMPLLKSKLIKNYNEYDEFENSKLANEINSGWESFFNYSKEHNIELLVYLHPTKQEVLSAEYDNNGKQLIHLFETNHINYVLGLNNNLDATCYRDFIHLNNKGQKKMAEQLYPYLQQHVQNRLFEINNAMLK